MKKLFVIALAAIGMVACVQNEIVETPKSDAIAFAGAYIDNATRAAADPSFTTDRENALDAFNVWGYMDEVAGTVFSAEEVEKLNGAWSYTNTQYWAPNHTYYFAALAPMENKHWNVALAGDPEAQKGLGTVTFENVNGGEDLIYAEAKVTTPGMNALLQNGMAPVQLEFNHLLSKVKFTFINGFTTDNAYVAINDIKMTVAKDATINLATDAPVWEGLANEKVLEFGNVAKLAMSEDDECTDERLTIPATDAYIYDIQFEVVVYMGTVEAYRVTKTSTVTGQAFEMGKAYNLVAEITPDNLNLLPIEFEVVVNEWETPYVDVDVDTYYDAASNTYHVATAAGLHTVAEGINNGEIAKNVNIVLTQDIDLSEVANLSRAGENNWTPIGLGTNLSAGETFRGTFDGQGHTISNMVCNRADVAGLFGYVYAATIKNVIIENATINSNHYAGGIVAWVLNNRGNIQVPMIIENCHVRNSTITSTPELVDGEWDNGDKVGGIVGFAHFADATGDYPGLNEGAGIFGCSVENTTIKAYRDFAGIAGYALYAPINNCTVNGVNLVWDNTNNYKNYDAAPATIGEIIGRDAGYNEINGCDYVSTAAALAAALTSDKENIAVVLANNIDLPITSLGQQTGGSGEYKLGGANTNNITIDLAGNKLNITTTYWSVLGAKNNDALFTIKNGTMTSSQATGTWNSYDLCFANCNYAFEDVVFEKAIALEGKAYNLNNVTINETHDYYAMWVSAKGQTINIDGLTINSLGRGIKIDEQYVSATAKVTMNVANATFKTAKKAAIVVKSAAGAEINWGAGNNIEQVAADDTFAVWVDENSKNYANLVVVNGAPCKVEGAASVLVYTAEDLNNLKATNAYVVLKADIDFQGAAMTKPIEIWGNSTFDGNGHKISNVKTAVQGGYATSLFRGDANPGNKVVKNLVVENLTTPADYSYAAAIWSDLQGANIEIDNVQINNATIAAKGTIGGFVGFVSGGTTSVVIKNSSINDSNLNGGEADHKRGAVVGRAYGCVATLEGVAVDNVKINDVAVTTSTLVGDKGYIGTVTVK